MANGISVDKNWTVDQKKKLQQMLKQYGFTDDSGNPLAIDGSLGPKSLQALQKMNTYQQHLTAPSDDVKNLQKQLNDMGYKDVNGNPLKEDGVHGPKTDAAANDFENNFLDGFTDGKNQPKTVQKKVFPTMPNVADAQEGQMNPDGTLKQVAMPGMWQWSGDTDALAKELAQFNNTQPTATEPLANVVKAQPKAGTPSGSLSAQGQSGGNLKPAATLGAHGIVGDHCRRRSPIRKC